MVWILQNHYSLHLYVKKNVSLLVHILKGEGHLDWNGICREDVRDGAVVHTAPSKSSKSRRPKAPKFQRQKTLWPHIIIKIISPSLNLRIGLGSAMEMIIMMMSVGRSTYLCTCQIIEKNVAEESKWHNGHGQQPRCFKDKLKCAIM